MKTIMMLLLAICLLGLQQGNAQDNFINKHLAKDAEQESAMSLQLSLSDVLSEEMINDLTEDLSGENKEFKRMIKDLHKMSLLIFNETKASISKKVIAKVKEGTYKTLMRVKDGKSDTVNVWFKENGSKIKEVLALIASEDKVIVVCFSK